MNTTFFVHIVLKTFKITSPCKVLSCKCHKLRSSCLRNNPTLIRLFCKNFNLMIHFIILDIFMKLFQFIIIFKIDYYWSAFTYNFNYFFPDPFKLLVLVYLNINLCFVIEIQIFLFINGWEDDLFFYFKNCVCPLLLSFIHSRDSTTQSKNYLVIADNILDWVHPNIDNKRQILVHNSICYILLFPFLYISKFSQVTIVIVCFEILILFINYFGAFL